MIDQRNLTFKHSVDAKSSLQAITGERFKRRRVYMGRLREIPQEYLQSLKNISLYKLIGRNRPIVLIDGYNETVHRGSFQLSLDRWIWDGRSGWAFKMRLLNAFDRVFWILIRRSGSSPRGLIWTVITPFNWHVRLMDFGGPRVHSIDARRSIIHLIRRSSWSHVTCIFNTSCGLVPHGIK